MERMKEKKGTEWTLKEKEKEKKVRIEGKDER